MLVRMRLCIVFLVASCATGRPRGSDGDGIATFRVFYPDQPADGFRAPVGKRFIVKPVATCTYENGRDARWSMTGARLASGELPEGFLIEEGTISGTPKAAGTWRIEVKFSGVTCAGKPHDEVIVPVTITAVAK